MSALTFALLGLILTNFVFLARGVIRTEVGMTITALLSLVLVGWLDPAYSHVALEHGFAEFSLVAILFTAIAVPSHILARSAVLDKVGMLLGEKIGTWARSHSRAKGLASVLGDHVLLVVGTSMFITWFLAGTLHNTTSILIAASIITVLCKAYKIPSVPVLSGALIASNLGGFSTRWGDTPNIIEAQVWGLGHADFFGQIMPINIGLVAILSVVISLAVKQILRKQNAQALDRSSIAYSMVEFRARKRNTVIDMRLALVGFVGLILGVGGSLFFPAYELQLAIVGIVVSIVGDYAHHRLHSLFTLGIGTYASLLSIFILSQVMAHSPIGIGGKLEEVLRGSEASVPVILLLSYFGTLLTEAASWATAAAPIVHSVDTSTRAAWALGAGICAGSSSLITAATAGIILLNETKDNEEQDRMTFSKYLLYGLGFSAVMLVYYGVVFALVLP